MSFNFTEFPILETERLTLRKTLKSDGPVMFFLRTDAEVNKYINRPNPHKTIAEAEAFIAKITKGIEVGTDLTWGIALKGEPELIGSICLWNFSEDRRVAEVGYSLSPKYHNQGIMSESLKTVLNFGFGELNLEEIEAYTDRSNESSKKLLTKAKFELVEGKVDEGFPDNVVFALKKTELD